MKKSILFIFISLFAFAAHAADNAHKHGHSDHNAVMTTSGLNLNDGKQWEMDEHTRKMSSKMEKTFFKADHSNQASLNALGIQLETQLGELIKGCTMSGKAHDQLHVFLSGHTPAIKSLAKADDYEAARSLAIKLKGNFENYKKHFK